MIDSEEIKHYLLGTCNTDYQAAEIFGISEEEVLDAVIESEIECCSCCGWWYESYEMNDSQNGSDLICTECFEELNEE